jgi:hypothetical protein
MQNFDTYPQASPSQYFGGYNTFEGSQNTTASAESIEWHASGHPQDPGESYNPDAFAWNYEQFPSTGFTGGAPMYGWPPNSSMP